MNDYHYMKVVYLDIDGVLNDSEFLDSLRGLDSKPFTRMWWLDMLDPQRVTILNELVAPDVKFVLSTSWAMRHTPEQMQSLLDERGFVGDVIGSTPRKMSSSRGHEILWDLVERKPTHYVVLDDMDLSTWEFASHWVQTDGLTLEDVERATRILGTPRQPLARERNCNCKGEET